MVTDKIVFKKVQLVKCVFLLWEASREDYNDGSLDIWWSISLSVQSQHVWG